MACCDWFKVWFLQYEYKSTATYENENGVQSGQQNNGSGFPS
jgi:hypothetical protein